MTTKIFRGTCEICDKEEQLVTVYLSITMCFVCKAKEEKAQIELENGAEERVRAERERGDKVMADNRLLAEIAKEVDSQIEVKTDIFNAKVESINELKARIDADSSIENKQFALAQELSQKFQHLKQVIFEARAKEIDAGNEQRAIQSYLNDLRNKLTIEERERIKLVDITYKPAEPKPVKTKSISTAAKFDKKELMAVCGQLMAEGYTSITLAGLQSICIAHKVKPEAAANIFKTMMKEFAANQTNQN